jgi:predicted glycoside hydrolase/deacetylase ChbG (UPF0249 family)
MTTTIPDDPRSIRLIVNADDFGICERVNAGIIQAHRAGIVTAASLMAAGRAFAQAVAWTRAVPTLDIGVHLALVAARPLRTSGSSLTGPDGRLPAGAGEFVRNFLKGRIRLADVRAELSAQIERVLDHGVRVSHLDSHQHVHVLPGIAGLTLELAARYRIPFVRVPVADFQIERPLSVPGVVRLAGSAALRACWAAARVAGAETRSFAPPRFLGFQEGGCLDAARLRRLIRALRPGRVYELMCHPGFAPEEPEVIRWNYRHETELHALTSPAIRSELDACGIELCTFKSL